MFSRNARSGILLLSVAFSLTATAYAQGPKGQFVCRRNEAGPPEVGGSTYFTMVANMRLNADGSFQAKDITTPAPEARGHFTYDKKAKTIEWDSGIWKTLLGHWLPNSSPAPLFIVTTKKDPEGKVDGTFQCVQVSK